MARGLNRVQIIGNLGADPEMRYTPSGSAVTNFRVAVSRNRRGQDGNMVDETEWFRVVAWDSGNYKLAEICNEYLRKGRKYIDKDGVERTSVEIVATDMVMLSGRDEPGEGGMGGGRSFDGDEGGRPAPRQAAASGGGDGGQRAPQRPAQRQQQQNDDFDSDLDDVPFD